MPVQQNIAPIQFGKYLLLDRIASGGMAELFLAKQTGLKGFEKAVAIKRILPTLTRDPEFVSMFINEAKLAALLSHQNIAQIFDLGTTEGFYYIAMEYIMGKDLRSVAQKSQQRSLPLPVGHALLIISRLCNALDYAHRKKDLQGRELHLVHRDVSPQNVLLSYEGEIKLVDFGIAKAATQTSETRTGTLKGKLAYMSPEQATGKPLDHRSDIFSLGIVLHELVTGQRLFTGDNEFAIIEQVRQAQITPPSKINPDLPPEVDELVMTALTKEPAERFQFASEMEIAIERLIVSMGYAFSSLSLANHMHALFEQEITDDTMRLQRIATISAPVTDAFESEQSTRIKPSPAPGQTSSSHPTAAAYAPYTLKTTVRQPTRHPIIKAVLILIVVACWGALMAALWRPDLVPSNLPRQVKERLRREADRVVARVIPPPAASTTAAAPKSVSDEPSVSPPAGAMNHPPQPPTADTLPAASVGDRPTERARWLDANSPGRRGRPMPMQRPELQELSAEARRAYQAGDLDGAEQNLRSALAINPQATQGYHLLAMVLREKKNSDAAIAVLTEGLQRFPENATLHHDLGLLYAEKHIRSLAIEELQTALTIEPTAPWADDTRALIRSFRAAPQAQNTISEPPQETPITGPEKE